MLVCIRYLPETLLALVQIIWGKDAAWPRLEWTVPAKSFLQTRQQQHVVMDSGQHNKLGRSLSFAVPSRI